jgi:hypothetical protein
MSKASPILLAFNAGELSPEFKGRIDLEKYKKGCEDLENFLPRIHGPARKRPGTRFVNEVDDSTKRVRLIPFEYSTTQAYILEFGEGYIRFYANGGVVLSGGLPYEITNPYLASEVMQLDYAQSADVIYITHPDHPPYKLSRIAATNWTMAVVDFDWPPFADEDSDTITVTASGATGAITLTASSAIFDADDVGSYFRISQTFESVMRQWNAGIAVSVGTLMHYNGNVYQSGTAATTGTIPPIHKSGAKSDGTVSWTYLHSGEGYAEITAYTSSTVVDATVIKYIPDTSATIRWSFSAWSERRGYPNALCFYEDRLWFAGSFIQPQTLWASVSGDYENHEYGTKDDDALNYTINSQDSNTIQWLSPGKVLAIGTQNGEFTLSAQQISDAVTPTNVRIVPQSTYGSAKDVRPLRVGPVILFLQRGSRKMREYVYDFNTDAYIASNMNVLADHITDTGVVDLAYQQEPDQIVWAPLTDGTLLGMTYERSEDVVGWHRHTLGGEVESVASIPHWDGDQDVTFVVVKRTIDGQTKRYIEYFEKYKTDSYALFVDSGLTYDGVPVSTVSGLDHLEGEEVAVLVDGAVHPNVTVSGGSITLQYAGSIINAGLPYTATLKTMPLEAGASDGVAQGKTMRLTNVVMRLHQTGPGLWYGPDAVVMDEYHTRTSSNPMDAPVALYTGDTAILPWPSGYQQAPQITVQHRLPTPCTIVAIMPQLHTYDR